MNFYNVPLMLLLVLTAPAAFAMLGNGQPNCTTQEEIDIRIFRNNWDPTSYWICEELNEPAILGRCPEQMAYLDSVKDCVSWDDWQWEQPADPLTAVEQS
ncbi:PREDICTED: uncharacterized protein LOC108966924 [Bactrocera latifrons]|uniref:Chitin-binding type-2 domain-containing protein n=1 Tax=Bactrocera latifrons TaxID=174628 RepID=A0A0K8W922_BACLA|nr:PREDICTED: uncharacterized protein LOC108966924 [Bactrocera latifrons]